MMLLSVINTEEETIFKILIKIKKLSFMLHFSDQIYFYSKSDLIGQY